MPQVSKDQVRKAATLARLNLEEHHVERLQAALAAILHHAECLERIDLDNIEPMRRPFDNPNRWSPDHPGQTLPIQTLQQIAPAMDDRFIKVPKVLPGAGES